MYFWLMEKLLNVLLPLKGYEKSLEIVILKLKKIYPHVLYAKPSNN